MLDDAGRGELIGAIAGLGHVRTELARHFPAMILSHGRRGHHGRRDDALEWSRPAPCLAACLRWTAEETPSARAFPSRILDAVNRGTLGFFALWTAIAWSGLVKPQFLPTPLAVLEKFIDLTRNPFVGYTLQQHLLSSFGRFLRRFALARSSAFPGLMMAGIAGSMTWSHRSSRRCGSSRRVAWCRRCLWFGTALAAPCYHLSGAFHRASSTRTEARDSSRRATSKPRRRLALPTARDRRSAAARIGASIVAGCDQRGARLAIADRRRADRRLERHRLPDGQGSEKISTSIVMAGMIAIGIVGLRWMCCCGGWRRRSAGDGEVDRWLLLARSRHRGSSIAAGRGGRDTGGRWAHRGANRAHTGAS